MLNHELLESLEYKGEYGCRYTCRQCVHHSSSAENYAFCEKQGVDVSGHNNVCRGFEARIKKPSAPTFNFDRYLEFLGSDFYRPWNVDTSIVTGRCWGPVGPLQIDANGTWYQKHGWKNTYKPYDKPYCRVFMPRCHVKYNGHKFEIDYRRYREIKTIESGSIHFDEHLWKDSPGQRKYRREIYGVFEIEG